VLDPECSEKEEYQLRIRVNYNRGWRVGASGRTCTTLEYFTPLQMHVSGREGRVLHLHQSINQSIRQSNIHSSIKQSIVPHQEVKCENIRTKTARTYQKTDIYHPSPRATGIIPTNPTEHPPMDAETQSVENNTVPVWCVGHHLSDPNLQIDAGIVDAEGNAGVRTYHLSVQY
jgi:hypothetical protein